MDAITTAVNPITIDSEKVKHEARCDLINRNVPDIVKIVQYDQTLPVLAIGLYKAGVAYVLPQGAACNIRIKKPDGFVIYNPALGCDSTRTIVYFDVTNQMTTTAGEMPAIVEVAVGAKIAGTSPLTIRVEKNPVDNDDVISDDEVQTLIALAGQATEAAEVAEEAAQTATQKASAASSSASTATAKASEAASSASSASGSAQTAMQKASDASGSASAAASSATNATNQAKLAESYAKGGTNTRTGENTDNAKYYKEQAAISAANLNVERILGNFATYQSTLTASKPYKVGDFLTYNDYLYRVTTAIASGGTITPGTNCVQTNVGEEVANYCLRFENVAVSAATGDIATITDARITTDHVPAYIEWGNSTVITTDCTLTTSAGSAVINGTCTAATTVTITLIKKCN